MNTLEIACAAGAILLASMTAVSAAPATARREPLPFPNTGGRWVYDGRTPPRCNIFDVRLRHFEGDGHVTGHEHLGHGHKWNRRGLKGRAIKPPCYVRRASARSETPSDRATAATGDALSGDLS